MLALVHSPHLVATLMLVAFFLTRGIKDEYCICAELYLFTVSSVLSWIILLFFPSSLINVFFIIMQTFGLFYAALWPALRSYTWQPATNTDNPTDISVILKNTPMREALRQFMRFEWSVENLIFIEAVDKFVENPSVERANVLWQKFFDPSSVLQINISAETFQVTREHLDRRGDIGHTFDIAYRDVTISISNDTLPRFVLSSYYLKTRKMLELQNKSMTALGMV